MVFCACEVVVTAKRTVDGVGGGAPKNKLLTARARGVGGWRDEGTRWTCLAPPRPRPREFKPTLFRRRGVKHDQDMKRWF